MTAQRRPGREPRRHHLSLSTLRPCCLHAQRRPGREPRRHRRCARLLRARASIAQRRPGREPRRHSCSATGRCRRTPALNEGRGVNPGDTTHARAPTDAAATAQRRPGREPRRHVLPLVRGASYLRHPLNEGRGVNPGDTGACGCWGGSPKPLNEGRGVNPGDTGWPAGGGTGSAGAQRRPGREPRRHGDEPGEPRVKRRRSTKAGA